MKKNLIMSIVGAVCMVFAGAAVVSAGTIVNSLHDFGSGAGSWTTELQICQPCHTPHNAGQNELLWNHETSGETYVMYSSFALDAVYPTTVDPTSAKCLSCHDGSVNIDAFGGAFGSAGNTLINAVNYSAWIGKDKDDSAGVNNNLQNDHPIGFSYAQVAATDAEIYTKAQILAKGGTNGNIYDILLANDTLGCYTCHDVHNTDTAVGPAGTSKLLRMSNASSDLCLTCHNK